MRMNMTTVGGRLRAARIRAGKSQDQVAHRLRCDQSEVSRWENGDKDIPAGQVVALCDYLGLTPNQLLSVKKPSRAFMQERS